MRLIDADPLMAIGTHEDAYGYVSVEDIANAPTIEPKCADGCLYGFGSDECEGCLFTTVKPKTGRWIKKEERVWYWYECSECGESPLFRNGERVLSDYCPNCGARMEEDDAD